MRWHQLGARHLGGNPRYHRALGRRLCQRRLAPRDNRSRSLDGLASHYSGTVTGAQIGARLAHKIPRELLRKIFGAVLLIAAFKTMTSSL